MTAIEAHPEERTRDLLTRVTSMVDEMLAEYPDVLLPSELAKLFRVDPKTVSRWNLPCFRTLGNHKRFHKADVREALIRRNMGEAAEAAEKRVKNK